MGLYLKDTNIPQVGTIIIQTKKLYCQGQPWKFDFFWPRTVMGRAVKRM